MTATPGTALVLTLCLPIVAMAAPVAEEETAWDRAQAERTAARWKAAGLRALPEIGRALCAEEDGTLLAEAEAAARRLGPMAAPALVKALGRPACLHTGDELAASLLCTPLAGAAATAQVRTATAALLRMLDAPELQRSTATAVLALALGRKPNPRAPPSPCPGRQSIAGAARADLLARLARGPSRRSADVTELVGLLGAAASDAVALLARRLDQNRDRPHALAQALADIGAAAAPATPALRALLAHSLARRHGPNPEGGDGRTVVAVYPPPWLSGTQAALRALAAIGPGAAAAGDDLVALVRSSADRACDPVDVEVIAAALAAQMAVVPARTGEVIGWLDRALARQAACTAGPPSAEATRAAWRASRLLVEAIARTPAAAAAPLAPRLAPLMHAPPVPDIGLRLAAARVLTATQAPLATAEAALRRSLMVRSSHLPWDAFPPPAAPAAFFEEQAARTALRALSSCRVEAGGPIPGQDGLAEVMNAGRDENRRLSSCLARRLCGPDLRAYRQALTTCCEYAFTARSPAWCTARW